MNIEMYHRETAENSEQSFIHFMCNMPRTLYKSVCRERCWEIKVVHIITAKLYLNVELRLLLNPVGISWEADYILLSCRVLPAATITLLSEMMKKTVENDQSE